MPLAGEGTSALAYFRWNGNRLAYDVHGESEQAIVLIHGLLMNGRMYGNLAPDLAGRGFQVVTLDLLGHGRSDRPTDMRAYSMAAFADQVAALVDHLDLDRPVVGGTSLGANVSLELAARHPEVARGFVIEMPVLDNALLAGLLTFTPFLVVLRFGRRPLKALARLTRRIPRSIFIADIALDWLRQDPEPSQAVLEGVLFGRVAPPREERQRITQPALVVGHPGDPLHPFSDAGSLVQELPHARLVNAKSALEWRISPARLTDELAEFVGEVYGEHG